MHIRQLAHPCVLGLASLLLTATGVAQQPTADSPALVAMKKDAIAGVESRAKLGQVMVDTVFSYSELGYQEFHSSKYLSDILESNGFKVERGIAGIPTAFMATWGLLGTEKYPSD
jgi:aminobenzoyl-glutamate utilization protein B